MCGPLTTIRRRDIRTGSRLSRWVERSLNYGAPSTALRVHQAYTDVTMSTGKPFWIDEGGNNNETYRSMADYGTYLALWMAAATNAGASATSLWVVQVRIRFRMAQSNGRRIRALLLAP